MACGISKHFKQFFFKVQALDTHFQMKIMKKKIFFYCNGSIIKRKFFLRTGGFSSYYKKQDVKIMKLFSE